MLVGKSSALLVLGHQIIVTVRVEDHIRALVATEVSTLRLGFVVVVSLLLFIVTVINGIVVMSAGGRR